MRWVSTPVAAGTVLGLGLACGVGYKPGLGAETLADSERPHTLIVGYLEQTAADPAVCDLARTDGVAMRYADARVVRALHGGLEDGRVPADRWAACVEHLWAQPDPALAGDLGAALLRSTDTWLCRGLDRPGAQDVGEALLRVLARRASAEPLDPGRAGDLASDARDVSSRRGPDTAIGALATDLADALELEAGLTDGEPVTAERIARTSDVRQLLAWSRRHPDPGLRARAGRRLLDVRIEASPFAWVREHPADVTAALSTGAVGLPPDARPRSAVFRPEADGTALLRVLQDPRKRVVRLLPAGRDGSRAPDASLDLVGSLWVTAEGLEREVTVCGPDPFDPSPCVPPRALSMTHPVAVLAPTGRIRFPEQLDLREFVELGRDGDRLAAQVVLEGLVAEIDLPIRYDSVPELLLMSPGARGNGPDATVDVWELSHGRLLVEVECAMLGKKGWSAIVESTDAAFSVRSHGIATSSQEGRGGDVQVRVRCTDCASVRAALKRMIRSTGEASGKVRIREVSGP